MSATSFGGRIGVQWRFPCPPRRKINRRVRRDRRAFSG